jgi:hypothetical protein
MAVGPEMPDVAGTEVALASSVSLGDPMQIMGISVMPYPCATVTPISRPTS